MKQPAQYEPILGVAGEGEFHVCTGIIVLSVGLLVLLTVFL